MFSERRLMGIAIGAAIVVVVAVASWVFGQTSRPTTLRTVSEAESLRVELRRAKAENATLRKELDSLRAELDLLKASPPTTAPTTPQAAAPTPAEIKKAIAEHKLLKGMTTKEAIAAIGAQPTFTNTKDQDTSYQWTVTKEAFVPRKTSAGRESFAKVTASYRVVADFVDGRLTSSTETVESGEQKASRYEVQNER